MFDCLQYDQPSFTFIDNIILVSNKVTVFKFRYAYGWKIQDLQKTFPGGFSFNILAKYFFKNFFAVHSWTKTGSYKAYFRESPSTAMNKIFGSLNRYCTIPSILPHINRIRAEYTKYRKISFA